MKGGGEGGAYGKDGDEGGSAHGCGYEVRGVGKRLGLVELFERDIYFARKSRLGRACEL